MVVTRAREGLAVDFLLLSSEDGVEGERLQVDHVDGIARFDAADAAVDDELLGELLEYALVVGQLRWELALNWHCLPGCTLDLYGVLVIVRLLLRRANWV